MSKTFNLAVQIESEGIFKTAGHIFGKSHEDAVFKYETAYCLNPKSRSISISLPLRTGTFSAKATRKYFEGLLPEGFSRQCVASSIHADSNDYVSILRALGEYVPGAGSDSSKLPGMGGVFNTVNLNLYHYSANNPIRYVDVDGRASSTSNFIRTSPTVQNRFRKFITYNNSVNCAAWAFDMPINPIEGRKWNVHQTGADGSGGYNPGDFSKNYSYKNAVTQEDYINDIKDSLKADGFNISDADENMTSTETKFVVGIGIMKNGDKYTYHFIRKESDGTWTQKPGAGDNYPEAFSKTDKISKGIKIGAYGGLKSFEIVDFISVEKSEDLK